MSHTLAPWVRIDTEALYYSRIVIVPAKYIESPIESHMVVLVSGCADLDEQEANARLIVSAPELLEALKLMTDVFQPRTGEPSPDAHIETVAWDKARQAIAKADGK